jgi:hypothetical protein
VYMEESKRHLGDGVFQPHVGILQISCGLLNLNQIQR